MTAQLVALDAWGQAKGERFAELRNITQPTLVVNGNNDVMIPTINSYTLAQHTTRGMGHSTSIRIYFSRTRACSSMAEAQTTQRIS